MTEDDARQWVEAHFRDHVDRIATFLELVRAENARQNLIAPSTIPQLWGRHAVDSLQLLRWAPSDGRWIDIGTGGGFPGMLVAIVRNGPVTLVEPRQKRAAFLRDAAAHLSLPNVEVVQARAETLVARASVISARAVASLETLFALGREWASSTTQWILPRGALSDGDMAILTRHFGSMFHVEHSVTSPLSSIVVASGQPR